MALRLNSRWHGSGEKSFADIASALAFIGWKLAHDKAINLHGQNYVYDNDRQRMDVIVEYLIFELQVVDRLAHLRLELDDEQRSDLVITLAKKLAEHIQGNSQDLFGTGDYVAPFFQKLNERANEYAEFSYRDDGPSYPFMRHLGYEIQQIMGASQENRWVIDQVMDQDGPEVNKQLSRALDNLFE